MGAVMTHVMVVSRTPNSWAIDPSEPATLYAATDSWVYRSTNRGPGSGSSSRLFSIG